MNNKNKLCHFCFFKIFFLLVFIFFFFPARHFVFAQEFKSDYRVEYFLKEDKGENIQAQVKYQIKITNLRSDIYVSKFALFFPKSFSVKDIVAEDDAGRVIPDISTDEDKIKITLNFNHPKVGKGEENNFYLRFNQDNLFKINGNVWEVIIPALQGEKYNSYQIIVHLPADTDKKISIAKPLPEKITKTADGLQVIWRNPNTKTIYAVFGDRQIYQTDLIYHLKNPKPIPVYMELAFPPDTLYQKIYVEGINPKPDKIYSDEDGNFLAKYFLYPGQTKKINFKGIITVYSLPRADLLVSYNQLLKKQKNYLLTPKKYWQLDDLNLPNLKDSQQIYDYVINHLKYDLKNISAKKARLGAKEAFLNPNGAVCTEFTDLFIALSRGQGIMSREIQGYGFSSEGQLRPLSLISDVLHAWPEYYDEKKKIWVPVDPTWDHTSGIDYFSSFDLNHIAFVIHGRQPDYPVPAGMYKIENSKDIQIKAINDEPKEEAGFSFKLVDLPNKLYANKNYQGKIYLKNLGNTYRWGAKLLIDSDAIKTEKKEILFDYFLPNEEKMIPLNFYTQKVNSFKKGEILFNLSDETYRHQYNLYPFYYQFLKYFFVFVFFVIFVFLLKYAFFNQRHG